MSVFWVILVRIFPAFPAFGLSSNAGKYGKNADQNNSKYGLFLRSDSFLNHRLNSRDWRPNSLYNLLWEIFLMTPIIARAALNYFKFLNENFIIWLVIDYTTIVKMSSPTTIVKMRSPIVIRECWRSAYLVS